MPIPIPITRTKIATAPWGIPLTNEVNRLTDVVAAQGVRLDAVEPKVATTAWVTMSLQNGWQNFGGGYQALQYRKIGDRVYIRGMVKDGIAGNPVATLPVGYRPQAPFQLASNVYNGTTNLAAVVQIDTNGAMFTFTAGTIACLIMHGDFSVIA